MNRKILFYLLLCIPFWGWSQFQAGLRTDNYNLLSAQTLNPASFVSFPLNWSVNIMEADLFVTNNYAYLRNTGVIKLIDPNNVFAQVGDTENVNFTNPEKIEYDVIDSKRNLFTYVNINIMGPSVGIKLGGNHYLSLTDKFRSHTNTKGIDNILSYNTYDLYPLLTEGKVDPFHVSHLTWSEFGLTYGYQGDFVGEKAAIAITLKYLRPYESFYFKNNKQLTFSKYSGDSILVSQPDFDIAFSPLLYDNEFESTDIKSHGHGFGVDIGFMTLIGGDENDYLMKVGASLTDLGQVTFSDSKYYKFNRNQSFEFLTDHYKQAKNVQELLMEFSSQTLNDTILIEEPKALKMWTPAKLGIQFDYRIYNKIFANFSYYKSIQFQSNGLEAPDQISLTPRIESRWFSAALPISLVQYQHLMIGTSIRIGPLVIGSDNVLSLFSKNKLYGTDIYMSLVLNPFKVKDDKGYSGYKRKRGGKDARCYEF